MKQPIENKELRTAETAYIQGKASCTVTLKCGFGTISCTSDKGNCQHHIQQIEMNDGSVEEIVTSISCDGKNFDCKNGSN